MTLRRLGHPLTFFKLRLETILLMGGAATVLGYLAFMIRIAAISLFLMMCSVGFLFLLGAAYRSRNKARNELRYVRFKTQNGTFYRGQDTHVL